VKEAAAMWGGDQDYLNPKLHSVVIGEGFHELWIGEGDQDLKTKMKDAGGSEGGDTLKRNEASRPWEEEGGILKLKKESMAAMDLWFRTQSPARMARKDAQEKAQVLGAGKKKMKVVKSKFPKELIEHMAACPCTVCRPGPVNLWAWSLARKMGPSFTTTHKNDAGREDAAMKRRRERPQRKGNRHTLLHMLQYF
jgi:hypothetical protein